MNPSLQDFQAKCDKVVNLFSDDIATVKTGRAKPSLVEAIKVNVYQSWMEIRELASISAPDAHTIEISPWDKTIIKDIVRGLSEPELRLNPSVSGEIIRINIPALTEETRKDLVKLIHQKAESHRAMIRQERGRAKGEIEDQKGISEDAVKADLEQMQKITDESVAKIDQLVKDKEEEITRI